MEGVQLKLELVAQRLVKIGLKPSAFFLLRLSYPLANVETLLFGLGTLVMERTHRD